MTYDIDINFDFLKFCAITKILSIKYHKIVMETY